MSAMTGLEQMQSFVESGGAHAPISATRGMRPVDMPPGIAVFEARPDERHLNPMGGVHGGYACTVLDSSPAARFTP